MECPEKCEYKLEHGECEVYHFVGRAWRERIGYCPRSDMYMDPEKQEAYELSKIPIGKRRVGQQKQRGR